MPHENLIAALLLAAVVCFVTFVLCILAWQWDLRRQRTKAARDPGPELPRTLDEFRAARKGRPS